MWLARRIRLDLPISYNIAPTQNVLAIRNGFDLETTSSLGAVDFPIQ
jgi:hypothetical protein